MSHLRECHNLLPRTAPATVELARALGYDARMWLIVACVAFSAAVAIVAINVYRSVLRYFGREYQRVPRIPFFFTAVCISVGVFGLFDARFWTWPFLLLPLAPELALEPIGAILAILEHLFDENPPESRPPERL